MDFLIDLESLGTLAFSFALNEVVDLDRILTPSSSKSSSGWGMGKALFMSGFSIFVAIL
jgi:hypothetical protein